MSELTVVYGGAFDPIGRHHEAAVAWLLAQPDVSNVIMVPSCKHPDKDTIATPYNVRCLMVSHATRKFGSRVSVSKAEKHVYYANKESGLDSPVYSYNLLSHLEECMPNAALVMAVGPDRANVEEEWHMGPELVEEFGLYRVAHQGPLRSTRIRKAIASKDDRWRLWVDENVSGIIDDLGLYARAK